MLTRNHPKRAVAALLTAALALTSLNGCYLLPEEEAVSYTHLDVYKRQGYSWSVIREALARAGEEMDFDD